MRIRLVTTAATAVFAAVLTAFVPHAFTAHGSGNAGSDGNSSGPQQQIVGLTEKPLVTRLRALLPHATVSTAPFDHSRSTSTDFDNTDDKDAATTGQITVTYNPDGTVWMVDCDATTSDPDGSQVLAFCIDLDYQGANPVAIRTWLHGFFARGVEGSSLQQQRANATWSPSVDNYGDGLDYGINVQPPF